MKLNKHHSESEVLIDDLTFDINRSLIADIAKRDLLIVQPNIKQTHEFISRYFHKYYTVELIGL
jgi:hypothetical protein